MRKASNLSVRSLFSIVALSAVAAMCYVARNAVQTGYPLYPLPILPPMLTLLANGVFWFVSAPDFRFGSVLFFLCLATVLYFCDFECTTHFAFAFAALATVLTVGTNAMQIAGGRTLHHWFCGMEAMYLSYVYIIVSQNMTKCAPVCRVVRSLLIGCVSLFFAINIFRNRGNAYEVASAIF